MTTNNNLPVTTTTADAVARYQYLLRTASPDQIEQAHEQAFAAMSTAERQAVLQALSTTGETPQDASAASLARSATRLEVAQPGTLQKVLGTNIAGTTGASLLAFVAAGALGSAVWGSLTGYDGVGGRPGLLSRLFGLGRSRSMGGLMGGGGMGGGLGSMFGGMGQGGGGFFGGGRGPGGGGFFGGGPGGPGGPGDPGGGGGGFYVGGPGGDGPGGPGGGPGR